MAEDAGQRGAQRVVCAVCSTAYDDAPDAHRIRRCPSCASRLIRQEGGGLGAVSTAAPPPKNTPRHAHKTTLGNEAVVAAVGGATLLLVAVALFVSTLGWWLDLVEGRLPSQPLSILRVLGSIVAAIGGFALLALGHRRSLAARVRTGPSCFACSYPLAIGHTGRCPECGRLQNPHDPRNGVCPGCRRSLRGFYGNNCPECGADVRLVTDGIPPADPPSEE